MAQLGPSDAEMDELVSHVMALRKDFIQDLLRQRGIAQSGLSKRALRDQVRDAISGGQLTVEQVVAFLDREEPGGKQHVFLMRPTTKYNSSFKDLAKTRQSLARTNDVKELLEADVPLLMPEDLQLSSVRLEGDLIEITAVEARRYTERDLAYDREEMSEEGLPVYLRAYVERVARSSVTLRWDVKKRLATLHITQATGRGLERDHYRHVRKRFADGVSPWLDFDEFKDQDLHKAVHELHRREQTKTKALTRSRYGLWLTPGGGELAATSPSKKASVFAESEMTRAVGAVSPKSSGVVSGNFYWLPGSKTPVDQDLHLKVFASEARINFMVPSSADAVAHVISEIRGLL